MQGLGAANRYRALQEMRANLPPFPNAVTSAGVCTFLFFSDYNKYSFFIYIFFLEAKYL